MQGPVKPVLHVFHGQYGVGLQGESPRETAGAPGDLGALSGASFSRRCPFLFMEIALAGNAALDYGCRSFMAWCLAQDCLAGLLCG